MNATSPQAPRQVIGLPGSLFVMQVGDAACTVRAFPVSPIHELVGFEDELDGMGDAAGDDLLMVADMLESRMIAPPRPRRRRERAVSSRAMFYSALNR